MFKNALLNALTYDTITPVIFNGLLTGNTLPTSNYKTMGEKYFDLVEFEGVVTANEVANLEGDESLASGKTIIGGKKYNLSTGIDDLGENRRGYAVGSKVLYIEDVDNNTWYNEGKAVSISTNTKFKNASGIANSSATLDYINFDGQDVEYTTSDWRIEYNVHSNYFLTSETDTVTAEEQADIEKTNAGAFEVVSGETIYKKAIRPDTELTSLDMAIIKEIFDIADREDDTIIEGEVYVGTSSNKDVSDEMSYKQFAAKYLVEGDSHDVNVTAADNGEWLKIIDNTGDGTAEYVFRVDFIMTTVTDVNNRTDKYTFEDGKVVDMDDVADELEEGDVVLYTVLDDNIFVTIPEVVTTSVNKRGVDYKNETITCGDVTYEWSGIEQVAYDFYHDVSEVEVQENYDLYLDHFGYVRLFADSEYNKGFLLLTDGYYEADGRNEEYKAYYWDIAEEDEVEIIVRDTTSLSGGLFVDDAKVDDDLEWDRLREFEQIKAYAANSTFLTNIATYSVNDSDEYALDIVDNASNTVDYYATEVVLTSDSSVTDQDLFAVNTNKKIQATNDTLYYFVLTNGGQTYIKEITTWVGYKNGDVDLGKGAKAYVVASESKNRVYDVAEIVVFETPATVSKSTNFVYALDQKYIGENYLDLYAIGYDSATETYGPVVREGSLTAQDTYSLRKDYYPDEISELVKFYTVGSDASVKYIGSDFADYNIFAGRVIVSERVNHRDYVEVEADGEIYDFTVGTIPSFLVGFSKTQSEKTDYVWVDGVKVERVGNVRKTYSITAENKEFSAADTVTGYAGDRVIFVTNSKGVIQYIINVDESYYDKYTDKVQALVDLWDEIDYDQTIVAPTDLQQLVINANNLIVNNEATYAEALELIEALSAEKYADSIAAANAKAAVQTKIDAYLSAAAAKTVSDQIAAIGTVTLDSEAAIVAARTAYDALTDAQKALVTNVATLTEAEAALAQLKKDATDADALATAQAEALEAVEAANIKLLEMNVEYDLDMQGEIALAYAEAVKAINEAEDVDAVNDAIEAYKVATGEVGTAAMRIATAQAAVNTAQANVDAAQDAVDAAQDAKDAAAAARGVAYAAKTAAATAATNAATAVTNAQNTLTTAQGAVASAEDDVADAEQNVDLAEITVEAKRQAMVNALADSDTSNDQAATDAYTAAQAALTAAEAALDAAEEDLADAKAALTEAQDALTDAQADKAAKDADKAAKDAAWLAAAEADDAAADKLTEAQDALTEAEDALTEAEDALADLLA